MCEVGPGCGDDGKLSSVSIKRRAESNERRLEKIIVLFCLVILGQIVPISVEFIDNLN